MTKTPISYLTATGHSSDAGTLKKHSELALQTKRLTIDYSAIGASVSSLDGESTDSGILLL